MSSRDEWTTGTRGEFHHFSSRSLARNIRAGHQGIVAGGPIVHVSRRSSSPAAASSTVHATSELSGGGRVLSVIQAPRRSSSLMAASSTVHAMSELIASGCVLLAPRLSTSTIALSPIVVTTHIHQLRCRARAAPQHGTSLRFSNGGQAPRAIAVLSWRE
uniref:Uncharacterized protein n=1 Tax=Oryza rufipogon TaxID=4529 RepID=A0A0E0QKB0_ORYRU